MSACQLQVDIYEVKKGVYIFWELSICILCKGWLFEFWGGGIYIEKKIVCKTKGSGPIVQKNLKKKKKIYVFSHIYIFYFDWESSGSEMNNCGGSKNVQKNEMKIVKNCLRIQHQNM
eukprot:TRINITY_DN7420_c0_g4_i1.p4 TRINITY_DN7420_c0_g4~~TRINITY_DN7420_c0_g4_i1.p4  ORF type:complete len:117 (-),score=13.66 TRINITY_DN7420_c0_g4_i1:394-744(-)